jgi:hypothetical protein
MVDERGKHLAEGARRFLKPAFPAVPKHQSSGTGKEGADSHEGLVFLAVRSIDGAGAIQPPLPSSSAGRYDKEGGHHKNSILVGHNEKIRYEDFRDE